MKKNLIKTRAWKKLAEHYKHLKKIQMRDLFDADSKRAEKHTLKLDNLMFDYSKNRFDDKVLSALIKLAEEHNLKNRINDMFTGKKNKRNRKSRGFAYGTS
jgi:glucose-6-phosphate isomerase